MKNIIINFEKKGNTFSFKNPKINNNDELVMDYKVNGNNNKYSNDGYFRNSKFLEKQGAMSLFDVKIDGKKIKGVSLPECELKVILNLFSQLKKEHEDKIENTINELISGKKNIEFKIVECDDPNFKAWVDLEDDLKGLENKLTKKAIERITGEKYITNACDFIERKLKLRLFQKKYENAFNIKKDSETQKYYNFGKNVITGFEMKLQDVLKKHIETKIKKETERQVVFYKAKETNQKQELNRYTEECARDDCDIDWIVEYAMPDGSIKIERFHTW